MIRINLINPKKFKPPSRYAKFIRNLEEMPEGSDLEMAGLTMMLGLWGGLLIGVAK